MILPGGLEWGLPRSEACVYCVRREGAARTLCGRRIDGAPIFQPAAPPSCVKCLALVAGVQPVRRPVEYGRCPVCGYGEVPLAGGVVAEHREWVVSRGGVPTIGRRSCDGEGQEPEA